jgi:hypothetical protein
MNDLVRAVRYVRGLRRTLRTRVGVDEAVRTMTEQWQRRDQRFVELLEAAVWPHPSSPARRLLEHAGYGPADVRELVRQEGLDATLARLVADGVYVSYQEWRGLEPARRGSATFDFEPALFSNPTVKADMTVQSSGTRSDRVVTGATFADRPQNALTKIVDRLLFDVNDVPTAVWMPSFPGFAGFNNNLSLVMASNPAEQWWSQTPTRGNHVAPMKRAVLVLMPLLSLGTGAHVPAPRYQPTSDPGPVLEWCVDALHRNGRALLIGYASSLASVATSAVERGVRLDGLVMRLGNEPFTPARRAIVEQAGATPVNSYNFSGPAVGGIACPYCEGDQVHVRAYRGALATRRRLRPDGVEVDAFCWTNLSLTAGQVWLNVENDDYGTMTYDAEACACLLGQVGIRQRVADVRGMSKVVAGGVTVAGEVFEELVDSLLPQRFGGGPVDYQFGEVPDGARTIVLLRVSPRLGAIDEHEVRKAIEEHLARTEHGRMALDVWTPSEALRIERADPVPARSGKTLAFEAHPR